MLPAHQGLTTGEVSGLIHLGLIVEDEFAILNRLAQVRFQRRTRGNCRLHFRLEKAQRVAACLFGLVHGQISALKQVLQASFVVHEERHANARATVPSQASEQVRPVQFRQYFFPDGLGGTCSILNLGAQGLQQQDKFITPQARNRIALAHTVHQPFCGLLQQQIPDLVPQRVVKCFEIVQINK